jgi:hypothetical protein
VSLAADIRETRRLVERLAREAEPRLRTRYALWHPVGQRRTPYRRFRKALGRLLRVLKLRPTPGVEPWRADLRHANYPEGARTLVIWALGTEREELRRACAGIGRLLESSPGRVPVLITDVADFTYFSRLGWLVEYVPRLGEPAARYFERKQRHLAWLYREADVLPARAALEDDVSLEELLRE